MKLQSGVFTSLKTKLANGTSGRSFKAFLILLLRSR